MFTVIYRTLNTSTELDVLIARKPAVLDRIGR